MQHLNKFWFCKHGPGPDFLSHGPAPARFFCRTGPGTRPGGGNTVLQMSFRSSVLQCQPSTPILHMASTLLVCWPFRLRFWSITQDEPQLEAALTFYLGQTVSGLPHCYSFLTRQVLVYIAVPTAIYPVTGVCAHVGSFGKDRLA